MKAHNCILWVALLALLCFAAGATADTSQPEKLTLKSTPVDDAAKVKNADFSKVVSKRVTSPLQKVSVKSQHVERATPPMASGEQQRQGGEDVNSATPILTMPFLDTGTTVGYIDNYNSPDCLGYSSNRPDVVYSYSPPVNQLLDVYLCGSSYSTNLWIYENDTTNEIACNRFAGECYPDPHSALLDVQAFAGNTYYIVIDGDYLIPPYEGQYVIECFVDSMPVPEPPASYHPAIAEGNDGYMLLGYEAIVPVPPWAETSLVWTGSMDYGETWMDPIAWMITNQPSYPATDYWGDDSIFYSTWVPNPLDLSGGAIYIQQVLNPAFDAFYSLSYWDWSDNGWHDITATDIACDDGQAEWEWGFVAFVGSTTYGDGVNSGPFISYQTSEDGWATISWYYGLDGCGTATCDIDAETQQALSVYDWLDPSNNTWKLFVREDWFGEESGNWDIEGQGVTYTYGTQKQHMQHPAIAAWGGLIIIVFEFWDENVGDDRDIMCWTDGHGDVTALTLRNVIGTDDSERFPRIQHICNQEFACTFYRGDTLMLTKTTDAGTSWSTPEILSGDDTLVVEFHGSDLAERGGVAVWEHMTGDTVSIRLDSTGIVPDCDNDSIPDPLDNCPDKWNFFQEDFDGDGEGDSCDACTDTDFDGYGNPGFPRNTCQEDNCPDIPNPGQEDGDSDGLGDPCDSCTDVDGDGYGHPDYWNPGCDNDNCPGLYNPDQADGDTDGVGDLCDNCPTDPNSDQSDLDSDGIGDVCDNCPNDHNPDQTDTDGDGNGDVCDICPGYDDYADFDSDGHPDSCDNCPEDANQGQEDADGDDVGDACDECTDTDGDGYGDPGYPANTCAEDNCPDDYNPDQADTDGDGVGDACCCLGIRGNVDGDDQEKINIVDLTHLVDFLFGSPQGDPPACPDEGNVDGDPEDKVNIVDLTHIVNYLFSDPPGPPPADCPE